MKSVLQDWITDLPIMQQSVLLCAIRGMDGLPKKHPSKPLLRWYRRCVLNSAFDGRALLNPFEIGGGSFTGPSYKHDDYHDWSTSEEMKEVVDNFLNDRDEYNLHFFMHFVHASEIIGYQHPDSTIAIWWHNLYIRLVHSLHLNIETKQEMEKRLSDNENNWLERSDTAETENYKKDKEDRNDFGLKNIINEYLESFVKEFGILDKILNVTEVKIETYDNFPEKHVLVKYERERPKELMLKKYEQSGNSKCLLNKDQFDSWISSHTTFTFKPLVGPFMHAGQRRMLELSLLKGDALKDFLEALQITIVNNLESFKDKFSIKVDMVDIYVADIKDDYVIIKYSIPNQEERSTLTPQLSDIEAWGDSVTLFDK